MLLKSTLRGSNRLKGNDKLIVATLHVNELLYIMLEKMETNSGNNFRVYSNFEYK